MKRLFICAALIVATGCVQAAPKHPSQPSPPAAVQPANVGQAQQPIDPRTVASVRACSAKVIREVQDAIDQGAGAELLKLQAQQEIERLQKRVAELEAQLPKKDSPKVDHGSAPKDEAPATPPGASPVDSEPKRE